MPSRFEHILKCKNYRKCFRSQKTKNYLATRQLTNCNSHYSSTGCILQGSV